MEEGIPFVGQDAHKVAINVSVLFPGGAAPALPPRLPARAEGTVTAALDRPTRASRFAPAQITANVCSRLANVRAPPRGRGPQAWPLGRHQARP